MPIHRSLYPLCHPLLTSRALALMLACAVLLANVKASSITLEESIRRVENFTPLLKSAEAELEQYEFLTKQQAQYVNPTLAFDAENVGGSDVYSGTDAAEYTLSLEQKLELGAKRSKRKQAAAIDQKEANLKLARTRELLVSTTQKRFLDVVLAQRFSELAAKRLEAAQKAAQAVNTRQEMGAANALDKHRMEIAVSLETIKHQEAEQKLQSARERLCMLWGARIPDFELAELNLSIPDTIPSLDQILASLTQTLSWKMNELELERKQSLVEIEKSAAYPDLTISAGRRWLRADDAEAWNVGIAIDLPIFNRNQHAIAAATAAGRMSNHTVAANRQRLEEEISRIYSAIETAWAASRNLSQNTIPMANETYNLVSEGYELGRYEILYLLEVQQTLFEIESSQLQSIADFFKSCNDLYEILAKQTPANLTI